jgi:hypothetical protein
VARDPSRDPPGRCVGSGAQDLPLHDAVSELQHHPDLLPQVASQVGSGGKWRGTSCGDGYGGLCPGETRARPKGFEPLTF